MDLNKSNQFYNKLKDQLASTSTWPSKYVYKFIVPSQQPKIDQITNIFNNIGAVIEYKQSSKGTYTSISITVIMPSPEAVISKYREVEVVDGVISL